MSLWLLTLLQNTKTLLLKIKVLQDARITVLSEWFHKEPLTSEESFCFIKGSLWAKKVLQIIKR